MLKRWDGLTGYPSSNSRRSITTKPIEGFFFFLKKKNLYHKGKFYLKKMSLSNYFFLHFKEKG